jgi:hypothetical protein
VAPRNRAVGLDEKYRGAGDRSPAGFPTLVHQSPRVDRLALDIGEQRKLETEAFREPRVLFDRVDRDRNNVRSGRADFFET